MIEIIKGFLIKHRRIVVTAIHILQVVLANYVAFVLRFESFVHPVYVKQPFTDSPYILPSGRYV